MSGCCSFSHTFLVFSRRIFLLSRNRFVVLCEDLSLSHVPHLFSSLMSRALPLVWSSLMMMILLPPLPPSNLALRRWRRHILGWPSVSPVVAVRNLAFVMLCSAAHSRFSVGTALLTTLLLDFRVLPMCSGSSPPRKVRGRIVARLLFSLTPSCLRPHGYFPWCYICMASSLTTSSQSGRNLSFFQPASSCLSSFLARWGRDNSSTPPSSSPAGPLPAVSCSFRNSVVPASS